MINRLYEVALVTVHYKAQILLQDLGTDVIFSDQGRLKNLKTLITRHMKVKIIFIFYCTKHFSNAFSCGLN
jgi:hypothetical protein